MHDLFGIFAVHVCMFTSCPQHVGMAIACRFAGCVWNRFCRTHAIEMYRTTALQGMLLASRQIYTSQHASLCVCAGSSFQVRVRQPESWQVKQSMSIPARVVQECMSQLASAHEGDRLVKIVSDVLNMLEQHGQVYSIQLKPSMVGISPLNRDGSGVNPVDVRELLSDILTAGWLDSRVTAIGVEPSCQADLDWNAEFFRKVNGILGTFDGSQCKVLLLAGSHTNCVLRCFLQEVAHDGDTTVCHDGKLSQELLRKRDAGFHRAVVDGLVWKVLSKSVAEQLPDLLSLVQRMGNATLQRSEHELQFMRRLHCLWISQSSSGSHVDFGSIKKKATTGKTVHLKALPHLYTFALKAVGGRSPFLLDETEAFVRMQSPSTRSLGPDFWEKISGDMKGANQCVRFRHAMVAGLQLYIRGS